MGPRSSGWSTGGPTEPEQPERRPIDQPNTREAWKAKYEAIYRNDRDGMERVEDFLFDMNVLPTPANMVKLYEFLETLESRQAVR